MNHDALRANLYDRRPPPRRRSAGPIRGSTPRLQPDLDPEEAIRTTRCGRTDSEMERMWSRRNGRQPNSLGTSNMTHGWVLPPAFALWYSHRSESRSNSRDATVIRRHQNASLNPTRRAGSMRGRSRTLREHGELQTPASGSIDPRALISPIIFSSRRHSPRVKLCMRPSYVLAPRRATGFALTRGERGATRRCLRGAFW